jgi:hypothetical protein
MWHDAGPWRRTPGTLIDPELKMRLLDSNDSGGNTPDYGEIETEIPEPPAQVPTPPNTPDYGEIETEIPEPPAQVPTPPTEPEDNPYDAFDGIDPEEQAAIDATRAGMLTANTGWFGFREKLVEDPERPGRVKAEIQFDPIGALSDLLSMGLGFAIGGPPGMMLGTVAGRLTQLALDENYTADQALFDATNPFGIRDTVEDPTSPFPSVSGILNDARDTVAGFGTSISNAFGSTTPGSTAPAAQNKTAQQNPSTPTSTTDQGFGSRVLSAMHDGNLVDTPVPNAPIPTETPASQIQPDVNPSPSTIQSGVSYSLPISFSGDDKLATTPNNSTSGRVPLDAMSRNLINRRSGLANFARY